MKKQLFQRAAAGSALALTAASAHAIDVAAVVTEIGTATAAVSLIAAAVFLVLAGIKVWKLSRRAM